MASEAVEIREVGPRDGLQAEAPVAAVVRAELALALADAGLRDIEAAAFVSPKAVPAMAGAEEVAAAVVARSGVRWWGLVPNARGAERALGAGLRSLTVTLSASPAYSRKNVGVDGDEAFALLAGIAEVAAGADGADGAELDVVVSCAFGSPFDDVPGPEAVAEVVGRVRATAGGARITLADTTGAATPRRVAQVLAAVGVDVGLHLHDTRGTALANALAAIERGVRRFDTSVGGLGGSPFAPGAGGNLATEDLVLVLADMGVATGVDLERLLGVAARLAELVGHPVASRTSAAGPLPSFGGG